ANKEKKWEFIDKYMLQNGIADIAADFTIYIGSTMHMVTEDIHKKAIPEFSLSEKESYLLDYVHNGPSNFSLIRSAKLLANYYMPEKMDDKDIDVFEYKW